MHNLMNVVLFNEFGIQKLEERLDSCTHITFCPAIDIIYNPTSFRQVHPLYQIITVMTMHAAGENVFKLSLVSSSLSH